MFYCTDVAFQDELVDIGTKFGKFEFDFGDSYITTNDLQVAFKQFTKRYNFTLADLQVGTFLGPLV